MAARLLSCVEHVCQVHGLALATAARPEHDTMVETVRSALGGEAFAESWAGGADLTLAGAVAEAEALLDCAQQALK